MTHIQEDSQTEVLDEVKEENKLIVFNDEVNSFQHVIITLMQICKHTIEQAEQCTMIIHNRGKCSVKQGSFDDLKPMKQAINDRGIEAQIE